MSEAWEIHLENVEREIEDGLKWAEDEERALWLVLQELGLVLRLMGERSR